MASRAPLDRNLLADLVERRLEAPDVEYKNWMPLTEAVERAKIARHICALANGGGGWLVFGFDDDGGVSMPRPGDLAAYDQDQINGIGEKYLEPQPHCEVHLVTASSGLVYPVIRVPAHGSVPVCAKADGPQEKGRPQGIVRGVHYVRAPGPKSVPINTPELWRDVLRRCVLSERTSLLASIGQLFDGPQVAAPEGSPLPRLTDWAIERWNGTASAERDWPVDLVGNRVVFAFRLTDDDGNPPAPLDLGALDRAIREAAWASEQLLNRGTSAFARANVGEARPGILLVDGREAYAAREPAEGSAGTLPVSWLVRDDGIGIEIAGFAEDNPSISEWLQRRRSREWPAGGRLAPSFEIDMTAERLAFVGALAQRFPSATRCELIIDYLGLSDRQIDEVAPGSYFSVSRSSRENTRRVAIEVGIASLTADLAQVTASLVGPITRLFGGWEIGPDYVRKVLEQRR
ncbi:ATP-binding protein [Sphingomonas sp. AP4-R1]|uniref:AlbA family DNA-binding domain-containing protein n=1 Tax=Sphingomonas sp. AP4-R1 TaxID=2735134 RepID=UPI001493AE41|nr:ATP-binding protein [Sphingomonas sp. AP4-R1]QJU57387.1 ATP-binding protein [Sphingomonas sp. AP4-R1]